MSVFNFISQGNSTQVNTTATLTLGVGAGQTAPPGLLLQSLAAGGTVTLPKINQVGPTAPGTPGTTPGISDGFPLTILSLTAFPTTITAASGDTLAAGIPAALNGTGSIIQMVASSSQSTWYPMNTVGLVGPTVRTVAGAATLLPSDRFLIITTTAATITIEAPANYQVGQEYIVDNTTSGSLTLTPASGNINTTASYTLTTLTAARVITDGTNFFTM